MTSKSSIEVNGHTHVLYKENALSKEELIVKSEAFYKHLDERRSVREYANTPIPKEVIETLIKTASTAPSGAHKQPWTFCAVSNTTLKAKIREAAEAEEKESYESRMSDRWLKDLEPMGTNMYKPFLEDAPWLIIVFKKVHDLDSDGNKVNNYYVNESVGIAAGMLITAIHNAGLVTLTHTPSPMNFLAKLLNRPSNERAFLLLPIGYPKTPTYVPDIERKPLEAISEFYE
ncbi:nitroreductase family protein [Maribacter sp. Asnod1-A12]|uniref:nitroreductase family protein n=1 Tax=Maribacter sp. Asnod1-A12 TaxID=3160576 RepID=UPI00386D6E10